MCRRPQFRENGFGADRFGTDMNSQGCATTRKEFAVGGAPDTLERELSWI
jgi:hypothetical protein